MRLLTRILGGLTIILSALSCTKEPERNMDSSGELDVSVYATIEDLTPADSETKASASQIVRLLWEEGDVVYAYDKTGRLGELKVTPTNSNRDAKLTGTIKAPSSPKITLVYCNASEGVVTTGTDATCVKFSLWNQYNTKDFFIVYATLDSNNQQVITNQTVPFYFATSLMKLTVTGLDDGEDVYEASIREINSACCLSINSDGTPSISGADPGTIRRYLSNNFSIFDGGRAIFTIATVDDDHTNRTITVNQGQKKFKAIFTSAQLKRSKSYTSTYALSEHFRGSIGGRDYVEIAGMKWATMNVGATEVVGPNSYGDYYVWGAVETAYSDIDFSNKSSDTYFNAFIFKTSNPYGERFRAEWKPSSGYTSNNVPYRRGYDGGYPLLFKYVCETDYGDVDNKVNLDLEDDVAHDKWGDPWRMPTKDEFQALINSAYWIWDDADKGYYLYPPHEGDEGKVNDGSVSSYEYKESKALLFFPASGYGGYSNYNGNNKALLHHKRDANYLSSSQKEVNTTIGVRDGKNYRQMHHLQVYGMANGHIQEMSRYEAFPIRPIADVKEPVAVMEIYIGNYSTSMTVGETVTFSASVYPYDANETYKWSSSNTDVATVDEKGRVTAIAAGTTSISVSAGIRSATKTVKINDKPYLENPQEGSHWEWD